MIYLFTALYCEAHSFIRQFRLEKNLENTRFQEFYHEGAGIRLIVTGVGEIAAAAAVSSVFTKYMPAGEDIVLNIGTCAALTDTGGVFLCNKIIEQTTGKTFYPDILYRHHFCEKAIVTGMLPYNHEKTTVTDMMSYHSEKKAVKELLPPMNEKERKKGFCADGDVMRENGAFYDMEAAAIYQAGSYFVGPHQMIFLKVVSDNGDAGGLSKEDVEKLMETYQGELCDFIRQLQTIVDSEVCRKAALRRDRDTLMESLCKDLHCSKVMRDSLRQHIHYWKLAGTDYVSAVQEMYREGLLPCQDKREGKLCFDELRRRLF